MTNPDLSAPSAGAKTARPRSIAAIAREFGVTYRALRFYEKRGLLKPVRTGVTRHYRDEDIAALGLILSAKSIGLTLVQIEHVMRSKKPLSTLDDIVRALGDKIESHLADLRAQRTDIETAIGTIEEIRGRLAK